ncbi:MAG: hypothetical protein E7653_04960 [Ruminococcaceae bacterium]|nr:hypothetical protein [Oscillospiraceae bacterium]
MDNKNNDGFSYTYSAKEQAEIKRIREKYSQKPMEEDKMEKVRRLDAAVTKKAQTVALILGILGSLILGAGMSLFMSELGVMLGIDAGIAMIVGVIVGVLGGILICLAYPIYELIVKRERKRIAPEIIRLTDELMK